MSPRPSDNFSSVLYLPLEYGRRYERAYADAGWRGVLYESFYSSVVEMPVSYDPEVCAGPGYLGYLFFMVYDTYLMSRVYAKVSEALPRSSTQQAGLRRARIRISRLLREMLSDIEIKMLDRYGIRRSRVLEALNISSFRSPPDRQTMARYFRDVVRLIENSYVGGGGGGRFYTVLRVLMDLGVTISLGHVSRRLEFMLYMDMASRYVEVDGLYDALGPGELMAELARDFGMTYLLDRGLLTHYREIYSYPYWVGRDASEGGYVVKSYCRYPRMASLLSRIVGRDVAGGGLRYVCRLCVETMLRDLSPSRLVAGTSVSFRGSRCRILIPLSEGVSKWEYEAY